MSKARVNMTKFYVGMVEALTKEAPKLLTKEAEKEMVGAVRQFVETEDTFWPHYKNANDLDHPWWTGTLHDSVAVRVTNAERNVAVAFMPKAATGPQKATASNLGTGRDYDNIVGWQYGRLFYGRMSQMSSDALVSWLMIGVPYGEKLEEGNSDHSQYKGFASRMHDRLYNTLEERLQTLGTKAYRLS